MLPYKDMKAYFKKSNCSQHESQTLKVDVHGGTWTLLLSCILDLDS